MGLWKFQTEEALEVFGQRLGDRAFLNLPRGRGSSLKGWEVGLRKALLGGPSHEETLGHAGGKAEGSLKKQVINEKADNCVNSEKKNLDS